jgi:hypothetical protein
MRPRCSLPEEGMKICIWGFLSMLNPFLIGSTLANQEIPIKIKKSKMAAPSIADFDISSELWFQMNLVPDTFFGILRHVIGFFDL